MTNEGTSVITFNVHPQTNYETLSIMPGNFLFCSDVRTFGCRLHAALWWPGCLFGVRHLVKSCGGFHWWDTVKPYHLPSFLLNDEQKDEQKDDRPKWQKYGIFASPKKPGPRVHKYPETIHIYWVLWSTEAKESCMRIVTTPRVLQLMRTMPARQGPGKGAYWTTQTKSETRSMHIFAIVGEMCWQFLLSLAFSLRCRWSTSQSIPNTCDALSVEIIKVLHQAVKSTWVLIIASQKTQVWASVWALTAVVLVWEIITSLREPVQRRCFGSEPSAM